METVNNITSAASRAVFGTTSAATESPSRGQPVSGELGDVKAGEPYDAGNLPTPMGEEPISGQLGDVKKGEPFDGGNSESQIAPDTTSNKDASAATNPNLSEQDKAVLRNSSAPDGPAPLPIKTETEIASNRLDTEDGKAGISSEGKKNATEKETGERYVPTSGVAAEGGEFEAGKSGAGKEVDHLLSEKETASPDSGNISPKTVDSKPATSKVASSEASPSLKKEKVSLIKKIKAKLHHKNKE